MCTGISVIAVIFSVCNYLYDRLCNDSVLALDVKSRNELFKEKDMKRN